MSIFHVWGTPRNKITFGLPKTRPSSTDMKPSGLAAWMEHLLKQDNNKIGNWNKGLEVKIQEKEKRGRKRIMDGRIRILRGPQESGSKSK